MKTLSAIYKGDRIIELSENIDLPKDTVVLVVISEPDDESEMHHQLQNASEAVFAKFGITRRMKSGMSTYKQRDIVLVP